MELCFNIWFIIDIQTGLSNYALLRPYRLEGIEEEKIEILNRLAETDYTSCERFNFAQNIHLIYQDGTEIEGYLEKDNIDDFFNNNIELFITEMESKLPPILRFEANRGGENYLINQKFPKSPLFCLTYLMENEIGEMKPYTKSENKVWCQTEKWRLGM